MESAKESINLEETITQLLLLMRDAEGADDRTLGQIFKRAQRGGNRATHRGKLGTYKYYSNSHSFGLVQPSNAEAEDNPQVLSEHQNRLFELLYAFAPARLEQIALALPLDTHEGEAQQSTRSQIIYIALGTAMAIFRLFPPGEWYEGTSRSVQALMRETIG